MAKNFKELMLEQEQINEAGSLKNTLDNVRAAKKDVIMWSKLFNEKLREYEKAIEDLEGQKVFINDLYLRLDNIEKHQMSKSNVDLKKLIENLEDVKDNVLKINKTAVKNVEIISKPYLPNAFTNFAFNVKRLAEKLQEWANKRDELNSK